MLLCWMLLIQAVMDIIANLKQNCFSDGVSFVFVALCICIRSIEKERHKNCFMIGSWRNGTAHTFSSCFFSTVIRLFFFDIRCYDGLNCAAFTNTNLNVEAPLCNHVVYNNKGYHIEWLVVFLSFSLLSIYPNPAATPSSEPSPFHSLVCVEFSRSAVKETFLCFSWSFCYFEVVFSISLIHTTNGSAFLKTRDLEGAKEEKRKKNIKSLI